LKFVTKYIQSAACDISAEHHSRSQVWDVTANSQWWMYWVCGLGWFAKNAV